MAGRHPPGRLASNKAKNDKDEYEKITGKKRSLKQLEDTNPFADGQDQLHWRNGLTAVRWL